MASSETEIANIALSRLGNGLQISALTEATLAARLCNLNYVACRDATLRAHPWNFAVRRAMLAQDTTVPAFEYAFRYALPIDCVRVIRSSIEAQGAPEDFRVEGRFLLSDEGTIGIEYIARVTDVSSFDDDFVDCLASRLAAEICPTLTESASMTKNLWDIHAVKLKEARSVDGQEGTPRNFVSDLWVVARA